jgi:AraC-like DNA-binding protein
MRDDAVEQAWAWGRVQGIAADEGGAAAPCRLPYARLVDHIQCNLARRIAVDELARIAQLSVFQLFSAFRRERATTPYRLVLAIRVGHAQRCLDDGATIAEAAQRAGFADQSHLTRHFKRIAGVTPKQYFASTLRRDAHAPASPRGCDAPARAQISNPAATRVGAVARAVSNVTSRRARSGSAALADTAAA